MGLQPNSKKTKVLSVRLTTEEAALVDESAASCRLNRNDYIRMKLLKEKAISNIATLDELVSALRQIEQACERYLDILEGLAAPCKDAEKEETLARIEMEISRAEAMLDLAFKVQKQAMRTLRQIRRKPV